MSVQSGRDILIRIGDGGDPPVFTAAAGLRLKTISLNARLVDVTNADSVGGWRELMDGAGLKTCAVSGSGVFVDAAADARIRQAFFDRSADSWQLLIPDFGTLTGAFQVAALDYAGRHDGEASWSMSLASAGPLVFEAL
ncbi:phage major tail protein, TP901-1 family [Maricaulis maris MCS10]|uniref:Phage major tail protein, TP901-1 family n=1 Tax=Maricaulis maris (strain MCS10) TaxID=394221 RepID=Q0AR68_MARMM|nr:phage major tail protein, TP901-1 family [Maricaulis maris]ABI65219.1 phage major tail protein, TP901-1 family [Maricaulis maris MCS10]